MAFSSPTPHESCGAFQMIARKLRPTIAPLYGDAQCGDRRRQVGKDLCGL
jgi:hypothetical protein